MNPLPFGELASLLVVRSDHIGDLVLSTPLLRRLRLGAPRAEITALVPAAAADVLASTTDLVDRVISREPPPGEFDLALALAPRTASLKAVYRTGARYRAGYVYRQRPLVWLGSMLWLTHRAVLAIDPFGEVPHEIEQLDTLGDLLGLPMRTPELEFSPATADVTTAREQLPGGRPLVVLHMGVRWFTGVWQVEDLARLADRCAESAVVVATAGPAERPQAGRLKSMRPDLPVLTELSLGAWAAVLGQADLVVSCDTGAVHLAAAQKTPVVVAYEPTTYRLCTQQWAPWRVAFRAVPKRDPGACLPQLARAVEELLAASRMEAG